MISEKSQKLIKKKWPGIDENKILLQFAAQELFNYAYPFEHLGRIDYNYYLDSPEQRKTAFYKRAKFKNRFTLFIAVMAVICALIHTVLRLVWYGFAYRYVYIESGVWLLIALIFYNLYRTKRKLITCFDELTREVGSTSA